VAPVSRSKRPARILLFTAWAATSKLRVRFFFAPLPTPPARADKQRKVVLPFVVTTAGGVRDIKVVKHFKPDFDSAAVNTVATWKFQPATKAGKAVAVLLETEIKFTPQ